MILRGVSRKCQKKPEQFSECKHMRKKGRILHDTFEQLAELGQSTAKKAVKQVGQTFNPLRILETEQNKKQNHTPLDFEGLKKKYDDQDKQKEVALRTLLFHLVKEGEKEELEKSKKLKQEEEQRVLVEEQEKKKKEEERKKQEQQKIPEGKKRRNIFSPKQTVKREHAEIKPSVGKQ